MTRNVRTEAQKQLFLSISETQHHNLSDKDEFYAATATWRGARLAVWWNFIDKPRRILAQRAIARDSAIPCRRAGEAKIVFVGSNASEIGMELFGLRFGFYSTSEDCQSQSYEYPFDESTFIHLLFSLYMYSDGYLTAALCLSNASATRNRHHLLSLLRCNHLLFVRGQ
jgi:hypothetical protein